MSKITKNSKIVINPDPNGLNKFQSVFFEYKSSHNDAINIIFHIIMIPLLVMNIIKIFESFSLNFFGFSHNYLAYSLLLFYGINWIQTDLFLGIVTLMEYLIIDIITKGASFRMLGLSNVQTLLIFFIFGFAGQIISHRINEELKHDFLESTTLILNTPILVNMELFDFLFGYKKQQLNEVRQRITKSINEAKNK